MQIINGKICKFLEDSTGQVNGFLLDTGLDVRFPASRWKQVQAIARVGSVVVVHARISGNTVEEAQALARAVINMDSKQAVDLYVPLRREEEEGADASAVDGVERPGRPAEHPAGNEVASEIDAAYMNLHRTQAMLAYLGMIGQERTTIREYWDEAKQIYLRSLTHYRSRDFEGARELAEASAALSRLVDILISRIFHTTGDYPTLVPSPPHHVSTHAEGKRAKRELDRVERLLARVQWVAENGTIEEREREQVRRLSSWSERFWQWGHRLLDIGSTEDAFEIVRAADAAVLCAEHLCRQSYVSHEIRCDSGAA